MYPVLAHYIVLSAWIREIIHLDIVLDAFPDEAQTVLPDHYRVYCALADKELALQGCSLVDEAGLCISFRIDVRMVHVPFAIHHFVPFPVYYRTTCNGDLEYVRVIGDERNGHETAVAPSVYADSVLVHIWQSHEHLHSFHLVCHFCLSALAVDGLFECKSAVFCSSVILDIDQVSSLSHVHFPSARNVFWTIWE